jgi:hypothetical protein
MCVEYYFENVRPVEEVTFSLYKLDEFIFLLLLLVLAGHYHWPCNLHLDMFLPV